MGQDLVSDQEYAAEVDRHAEYTNTVLGLLLLTVTLTCLQFDHPERAALVALIVVVPAYVTAIVRFPPTMKVLRDLKKKYPDNNEVQLRIEELTAKYHGWRSIPKFAIFFGSLGLFISVLVYHTPFSVLQWVKEPLHIAAAACC